MIRSNLQLVINLSLNVLNVLFLTVATILLFSWASFPLVASRLSEIAVAEHYRRVTLEKSKSPAVKPPGKLFRRDSAYYSEEEEASSDFERGSNPLSSIGCVVGWREDPGLFKDGLRALKKSDCISGVVVGVDGDLEEDEEMIKACKEVFPYAYRLHFAQPLGEILESAAFASENSSIDDQLLAEIFYRLWTFVKSTIAEQVGSEKLESISSVCISQPHRCKKDIQFTSLLVSMVLAESRGAKFIWGSDSDSVVQGNAIRTTVELLARDLKNGGSCARLRGFHRFPTPMSKMQASMYWFDQDIARMQTAAFNSAECQPGPCSAFRVEALKDVLSTWYLGRLWGRKMITNEDRHLTANLLREGWAVQYASSAVVLTETPSTKMAWIRQQIRWSRGTHLERISRPIVYARQHPWVSFQVWKEQVIPLIAFFSIIECITRGKMTFRVELFDMVLKTMLDLVYTFCTAADSPTRVDLEWLLPGFIFYSMFKPAVHIWALATVFDSSWGIKPADNGVNHRSKLVQRWYDVGFLVVWFSMVSVLGSNAFGSWANYYVPGSFPSSLMSVAVPILVALWLYWSLFKDLHA